jgi:transposase
MQQSKYSKEFREEAIRMAERDGVAAASEKLGVDKRYIYDWRRVKRLKKVQQPKGLKPGESVEDYCNRLESECSELREANYILRKAMGFLVDR